MRVEDKIQIQVYKNDILVETITPSKLVMMNDIDYDTYNFVVHNDNIATRVGSPEEMQDFLDAMTSALYSNFSRGVSYDY